MVEELFSDVDSEADRLLDDEQESTEGSEMEFQVETEDVSVIGIPRAARGSHVVTKNGYFFMTRDSVRGEAKMILYNKWWTPECLKTVHGTNKKSKTVVLAYHAYDGPIASLTKPIISYMVLRSWMIWRSNHGVFLDAKQARRWWHGQEIASLRNDIRALGQEGGGTGSAAADARIQAWCPEALM